MVKEESLKNDILQESILVVIPTYNESENMPILLEKIFSLNLPRLSILIVDDSSPDNTGDIVRHIASQYNWPINVISRSAKLGLGTAYKEGFEFAIKSGHSLIVQMDADLSHNPMYLPEMLEMIRCNDVVIGSRYTKRGGEVRGWGLHRRVLSVVSNIGIRWILNTNVRDITSGFKIFRANRLSQLDMNLVRSTGFGFQVEIAFLCNKNDFKICELPIIFEDRIHGKSKMSVQIIIEIFFRILCIRVLSLFTGRKKSNFSSR